MLRMVSTMFIRRTGQNEICGLRGGWRLMWSRTTGRILREGPYEKTLWIQPAAATAMPVVQVGASRAVHLASLSRNSRVVDKVRHGLAGWYETRPCVVQSSVKINILTLSYIATRLPDTMVEISVPYGGSTRRGMWLRELPGILCRGKGRSRGSKEYGVSGPRGPSGARSIIGDAPIRENAIGS
jgi:hypothetical protein